MSTRQWGPQNFSVELLEPRLLLSADWAAVLAPPWSDHADASEPDENTQWLPTAGLGALGTDAPAPLDLWALGELHGEAPSRVELIVVDAGVDGYGQMVADITGRESAAQYVVRIIDANADGVASLSALLDGFDELAAVHIVSHGDDGGMQLGNTWLDSASVSGYAEAIGGWSSALADDADLLLYGCNLAGTADGQQLVGTLAALTGADVAASTDLTGQDALGGDWVFEHQVGTVNTTVVFSATLQAGWSGVLAAFIIDTDADTVDVNPGDGVAEDASGNTSLRAAIMEANALPGADFIQLPAGDYDMTIAPDITTFDASGDFDIFEDVTIVGAGADVTFIDANNLHRLFELNSGTTVTISGVTIERGANIATGGGILVQADATLTLYEAVVRDNDQNIGDGGGIHNEGTLILDDVTFYGNDAFGDGGALYNDGDATLNRVTFFANSADRGGAAFQAASAFGDLSLTNATVSSNSAGDEGGGIYSQQTTIIQHSTVTNNAANFGGGIVQEFSSPAITVGNSIIAGNTGFVDDVSGNFSSLGFNLIGEGVGSTGFANGSNGDQVGTGAANIDPVLGALADNGGYVLTHALLPGSPAIDAGDPTSLLLFDARVASRDAAPDIGAYERDAVVNATPTASNLNQAYVYLEDDGTVILTPIVVSDADVGEVITATLMLSNPSTGALTTNSGNGESYTAGTGVWTITADVARVNAALADMSFTPATDNAQSSYITTTVRDASGHGPPTGLILLDATPVNDAPDFTNLGNQVVLENSGAHVVPGFAVASPGGGVDEAGQTFIYTSSLTNAALFAAAPVIDPDGTLRFTLNPGVSGTSTITVKVRDSGGVDNGGVNTSADQVFNIFVLPDTLDGALLFSTSGDVSGLVPPGLTDWNDGNVIAFGEPGFSLGPDAGTSGEFGLQFDPAQFGVNADVNGMHFVNSAVTVGSGAGEFLLQSGDLLLTFDGGGSRTFAGTSTSITVQDSDVFVFRPQAPGDYTGGEFYYLLDNPLNDSVRGLALVESASVTIGDGPPIVQGTFLLSKKGPGEHDNIYTYLPLTVGDGSTASTLGSQLLINAEGAGNLNFSDQVQGIHLIEEARVIGGISFLPGDLLLTLNEDQDGAGEGVGTNRLQAAQNDVFRLRLSETHQGPNGRSIGVAALVFDGSSMGLSNANSDLDGLTFANGASNAAPVATNLDQTLAYTEDAAFVELADIVVSDADGGDTITVVLTLADVTTGTLTTGSGNGEVYDSGTGIWTVTGTVAQVNVALAAVTFVPAANNAVSTTISTHVEDVGGLGPVDGVIALNVTPVNDAPSFTLGPIQTVLEDSGPHTVGGFAAALPGGGADEAAQTFFYTMSTDNPGLFLVAPTIDASGTLTYTLNPNASGSARVTVAMTDSGGTANGGVDTSPSQFFDIVVTPVNDAPLFALGPNQNVLEDNGPQTVAGFAAALPGGGADEAGQNFAYIVTPDNSALFAVGPAIDASGTLTYTLNANATGTARITVTVTDSGGTANGGVDTAPSQFFDIVVTPVNDAPTLSIAGDQMVMEDSGFHSVTGFASALPGGGVDEAGQNFAYAVTPDNAALFAVGPAIDASGTLTYTLNANATGTARITVTVTDSGGTANGGVDTSQAQFFDIVVAALPDSATAVNLDQVQVYVEDAGRVDFDDIVISGLADSAVVTATLTLADTDAGRLTADSGNGESYEATSGVWSVTGTVTQVNAALADVGLLSAVDSARDTTVTVLISYPPGNPPATGLIRLDGTAVNDAPSLALLGDQTVLEDAGSQQLAGFAAAFPGGGVDEAGQAFTYRVDTDNPGLFTIAPSIDSNGTLTYTLAANASGSTVLTVTLTDSGGLDDGGQNAALARSFVLDVLPVNDAPTGSDARISTFQNSPYTFSLNDFGFSDVADGDAFAAIRITSVPEGLGTLSENARQVRPGDVIDASTIAAGGLVFVPQSNAVGGADGPTFTVTGFGFRVQDSGGTALGGVDSDSEIRRMTIDMVASSSVAAAQLPVADDQGRESAEATADVSQTAPAPEAAVAVIDALSVPEQPSPVIDLPFPAAMQQIAPLEVLADTPAPLVLETATGSVTLSGPASGERAPERAVAPVPDVVAWEAQLALETQGDGRQVYYEAESATALSLDRVRDSIQEDIDLMHFEAGQTAGAMVGLSVGYVSWLLRGGVLLSSVLSSVPTWRFIDPLPVFPSVGRHDDNDDDDESLEAIVRAGANSAQSTASSLVTATPAAGDDAQGDRRRA